MPKLASVPKTDQPMLGDIVPPTEPPKLAPAVPTTGDLGFAPLDETTDYLNVLYYGREGTTKTTSLAAAANICPDGSRILVINAEGGLKATALRRRGIDTSKVVIWPDPASGIEISKHTLDQLHERLHDQLMRKPGCWFAVGVDSITDVVSALRIQATQKRIKKALVDPRVVDKSLIDPDFVDRDDYGVMTNALREWFRDMRDLPCHLIVTALERVEALTGMVGPAISPALATDILGYVDITMYLRATVHATGEDDGDSLAEYRALTRPGKVTRAKDRFDVLPKVLVEPTFERVYGYFTGALVEDTDPIQAAYVARRAQEAKLAAEAAAEAETKTTGRAKRTAKKDTAAPPADS